MMRNKKRAISNFFILLVLVAGISWVCGKFIHLGSVEYTDNAQVKQHLTPVSTRVQGFIKKICFEEYQTVKKGDTLAIIEDTDYHAYRKHLSHDLCMLRIGILPHVEHLRVFLQYPPEHYTFRNFLGFLSRYLYHRA